MNIAESVALVTGANRGSGRAFVENLLGRGVKKIYAAAREQDALPPFGPRCVPLTIDVTDRESVWAAATQAPDVTLLINNAGLNHTARFLDPLAFSAAREEMEVNYFGTLEMCRAFAPSLSKSPNGTIVNMLSVLARVSMPAMGSLCASKAAAMRMTEGIRAELRTRGVRVIGVLPGAVDTEMSKDFPPPKMTVRELTDAVLNALAGSEDELYPGDMASTIRASLLNDRRAVQEQLAHYL